MSVDGVAQSSFHSFPQVAGPPQPSKALQDVLNSSHTFHNQTARSYTIEERSRSSKLRQLGNIGSEENGGTPPSYREDQVQQLHIFKDYLKRLSLYGKFRRARSDLGVAGEVAGGVTWERTQSQSRSSTPEVPQAEEDISRKLLEENADDILQQQIREVADAAKNTCTWVTEFPEFKDWSTQNNDAARVLIILAKPGFGKTVLAKFIYEELIPKRPVLSFFCKAGKDGRDSACSIVATWLYRLLTNHQDQLLDSDQFWDLLRGNSFRHAMRAISRDATKDEQPNAKVTHNLCTFFAKLSHLSFMSKYAFVLDALDECTKSSQNELLEIFRDLSNSSTWSYLITARREPIPVALSEEFPNISIPLDVLSDDITRFVTFEFHRKGYGAVMDHQFLERVQQLARNDADGSFLMVACRVREIVLLLDDPNLRITHENIQKRMQGPFHPVTQHFGLMLEPLANLDEPDYGILMLNLILASQRPLLREELSAALLFSKNSSLNYDKYKEQRSLEVFREAKNVCGSILDIQGDFKSQESTIAIVHGTVQEMLMMDNLPKLYYSSQVIDCHRKINITEGHVMMAKACLRFLAAPVPSEESLENFLGRDSYLNYALNFWDLHVRESRERVLEYKQELADFFRSDVGGHRGWLRATYDDKFLTSHRAGLLSRPVLFTLVKEQLHNVLECMTPASEPGFALLEDLSLDLNSIWGSYGTCLHFATRLEYSQSVERLLELGADPLVGNVNGVSPLHVAVSNASLDIIKLFDKYGADFDRKVSYQTLEIDGTLQQPAPKFWIFAESNDKPVQTLELLLSLRSITSVLLPDSNGYSFLHEAASLGCTSVLSYILSKDLLKVDIQTVKGETALMVSILSDEPLEAVNCLLSWGADVDIKTNEGLSALALGAMYESDELLHLLLCKSSDIGFEVPEKHEDFPSWKVLHFCAARGLRRSFHELLERRVDVHSLTAQKENSLFLAVGGGHADMVAKLLDLGVDPNQITLDENYALKKAAASGYLDIVKLLIDRGAKDRPDEVSISALHIAAWTNHAAIVERLITNSKTGANIDQVHPPTGWTPLHCAVRNKHVLVGRLLVLGGASVDVASTANWLPLHYVCSGATDPSLFELVLVRTNSSFLHTLTKTADTPLQLAAQSGFVHAIKRLLDLGSDESVPNADGTTPLMLACTSGNPEAVRMILDRPDNFVNRQNINGWTALHYAAQSCKDVEVLEKLVSISKFRNRNRSTTTPLNVAVRSENFVAVEVFLRNKMPPDFTSDGGRTPLYTAAACEDVRFVALLLQWGADPETFSAFNVLPITCAFNARRYENISALKPRNTTLLGRKADITLENSALEAASLDIDTLRWVVQSGVSPFAKACLDYTALHNAAYMKNVEVLEFLMELPNADLYLNDMMAIDSRTPLIVAVMSRYKPSVDALVQKEADLRHRDYFGFCVFDYALENHDIMFALMAADRWAYEEWVERKADRGQVRAILVFRAYKLIQWLRQKNEDVERCYLLQRAAEPLLIELLFYLNDSDNAMTFAEHLYGVPSNEPDGEFRCTVCLNGKKGSAWLCPICPHIRLCNECKTTEASLKAIGCDNHQLIALPSESWYKRDRNHVNDKEQTYEAWLLDLEGEYQKKAEGVVIKDVELLSQFVSVPYEYGDRPDIFELLRSDNGSGLDEHLFRYARDIWQVNGEGNNLAMVAIDIATSDVACLKLLRRLQYHGAAMLVRNSKGKSSVRKACEKDLSSTTAFLLSCYDQTFGKDPVMTKMSMDDDEKRSGSSFTAKANPDLPHLETTGKNPMSETDCDAAEAMSMMISKKWRNSLILALERHFAWASQGRYEFLKELDLMDLQEHEMVDILLQNHVPEFEELLPQGRREFFAEFERPEFGRIPKRDWHKHNCIHSLSKNTLSDKDTSEDVDVAVQSTQQISLEEQTNTTTEADVEIGTNPFPLQRKTAKRDRIKKLFHLLGFAGVTPRTEHFLHVENQQNPNCIVRVRFRDVSGDIDSLFEEVKTCGYALLEALNEAQELGVCCDSFSIIVEGPYYPQHSQSPFVCLRHIRSGLVIDFVKGLSKEEPYFSESCWAATSELCRTFSLGREIPLERSSALHVAAEVTQMLCLGFLSFLSGHRQNTELPIIHTPIPTTILCGTGEENSIYFRPQSMTCVGRMVKGKLMVFASQLEERGDSHLMTDLESMLEIWGPGTCISKRMLDIGSDDDIIIVHLQDGYLTMTGESEGGRPKAHWALSDQSPPTSDVWTVHTETGDAVDGEMILSGACELSAQVLSFKLDDILMVGALRQRKTCDVDKEATYQHYRQHLTRLGTADPFWTIATRQISTTMGYQGAQFALQLGQTHVAGVNTKADILEEWKRSCALIAHQITPWGDVSYATLNEPHGVIFSVCSGFAQRVSLREALSEGWKAVTSPDQRPQDSGDDEWRHFLEDFHGVLKGQQVVQLPPTQIWSPELQLKEFVRSTSMCNQVYAYCKIGELLSRLQRTAVSEDKISFKIAWFHAGDVPRAYRFYIDEALPPRWHHLMQDGQDLATFAVLTEDCLVSNSMYHLPCSNESRGYAERCEPVLLDTIVGRHGSIFDRHDGSLLLKDRDKCWLVPEGDFTRCIPCVVKKRTRNSIDLIVLRYRYSIAAFVLHKDSIKWLKEAHGLFSANSASCQAVRITPLENWRSRNG